MAADNSSPIEQTITEPDLQAVKIKLIKAQETINQAIGVCDGAEGIEISVYINCASSYLFDAARKAGKGTIR